MIEQYYKLDVDRFYRDYKGNERLLVTLKQEKEAAAMPGSMDYSAVRVSGGETGDPTASRAFKRMNIDRRIQRVEEYFDFERKIYEMLTDEEKVIADCLKDEASASHIASRLFVSDSTASVKISRFKCRVRELASWV